MSKYLSQGNISRGDLSELNSNNTHLLDVEGVKKKLLSVPLVEEELKKFWENR